MQLIKPLLSIYIPTYKRNKELIELLTIIDNERKNIHRTKLEVVVSDNNGDLSLRDEAALYVDKWYSNPVNLGGEANIHLSRGRTSGEYIWIIGDDDLIVTNSLDKIIRVLENKNNKMCNLIYLNRFIATLEGKVIVQRCRPGITKEIYSKCEAFDIVNEDLLTLSTLIVKREVKSFFVDNYGRGYYCEGLSMALDALSSGSAYCFNEPQVIYRNGDKSSWSYMWPRIFLVYRPYILFQFEKRFCNHRVNSSFRMDKTRIPLFYDLLKYYIKKKEIPKYEDIYCFTKYVTNIRFYTACYKYLYSKIALQKKSCSKLFKSH